MRNERTPDENRILNRIDAPLKLLKFGEFEIDPNVIDAPDIILTQDKLKIGIEITRLDYEEHCHWRHLTSKEGLFSRAAEITIDLEKMLGVVAKSKWRKYETYKADHGLNECWLILFNDAFEFKEQEKAGHPNRKWFENYARLTLRDLNCPFDRVWFNLQHPDLWYQIYKKSHRIPREAKITRWPSVILKEVSVKLDRGVTTMDFDNIEHRKTFD